MTGSLQLRLYRIARRDGVTTRDAAALAGIGAGEAALTDAEDAQRPPGPEAYQLTPGMARMAVGRLAGTPLGDAAVARLAQ